MSDLDVTPDLRQRGLSLCKQFLGGSWTDINDDCFEMSRVSGGLSNLLYMCSVLDKVTLEKDEQRKVLLRIYGQIIHENPETVVTDSVIFALLAEKKMGPQLFGVFTGGRVEEYIKSRHLHTLELHNPDISAACAQIMAQFHQLTMPLVKQPLWLFDIMTRYLDEALNNLNFDHTDPDKKAKLLKVMSYDLSVELSCLKNILSQVDSPVVFCHNDLQEGNILYSENDKAFNVMPIDFEYASYNYRGFDFGNHFCEWCYDYSVDEAPYYSAKLDQYPTRDQQLHFIRAYLDASPQKNDINVTEIEEQILLEANTFALASHFMWGLWSIVQSQISKIQFGYLDYALDRFDAYFTQKKNLPSHLEINGK